ncbi:hypothetical protein ASF19_00295 [Acidovorax sp. Leaf84]|nr:hypothetical protein ASF19_00295 [Acidovorax sp. Leaf84]
MNNTARFLSIAAVAAFASFGAQADEADASQYVLAVGAVLIVSSSLLVTVPVFSPQVVAGSSRSAYAQVAALLRRF